MTSNEFNFSVTIPAGYIEEDHSLAPNYMSIKKYCDWYFVLSLSSNIILVIIFLFYNLLLRFNLLIVLLKPFVQYSEFIVILSSTLIFKLGIFLFFVDYS